MPGEDDRRAYREALEDWQGKLEAMHEIVLERRLDGRRPDQIKGILQREERAKQRYDELRRRLLGLDSTLDSRFD